MLCGGSDTTRILQKHTCAEPELQPTPIFETVRAHGHTIIVGAESTLRFSVKLPEGAKPGSVYTLDVKVGKFADSKTITIVGVPVSASNGFGAAVLWIVAAIVLVALVALFLILPRRRHPQAAA